MDKYYNTKESVQEYISMAKGYDGGEAIQELSNFLDPGSEILEIGSGPGTDFGILKSEYRPTGSDNSAEFLKHLNASFPGDPFLQLDASSLETVLRFDCIYSNKVLHHLEDKALEISITRQFKILNPGGIVCHTFWKGEDSEVYNGLLVNYQSDTGLKTLFDKHFEALLIRDYKEFEENDSILFIGRKKEEILP